jgi:hypothetical protein
VLTHLTLLLVKLGIIDTSKDLKFTGVSTAGAWATGNNMNTARNALAGCGTQTAALAFGGYVGPPGATGATEEYDGSTWTNNPTGLNTARNSLGGAGTQTAALAFGGSIPPPSSATEEYDGSTWTTSPGSLNTARYDLAGCGTQTAALGFWWFNSWSTCYCFISNRRIQW